IPFPQTTLGTIGNSVTIDGSLTLDPEVTIELSLRGPCLGSACLPCPVPTVGCTAEGKFELDGGATLRLAAFTNSAVNVSLQKSLGQIPFPPLPPVGPVVFVPTFDPLIGISAVTKASGSVDFWVNGGVSIGAECSSTLPLPPSCDPIFDVKTP